MVELAFTQDKFGMLFGDQKDDSYLKNCLIGNLPSNESIFFIAGICITIILFENQIYLFDSHSRDVFGIPNEDRFFICIKFWNYESVVTYIYNLFVNSAQVQFENQFINCIISDFSNDEVSISLIDSENLSEDKFQKRNSEDKKEELNVGIKCHELQLINSTCRTEKCYFSYIARIKSLISEGPTFICVVCNRCLCRTYVKKGNEKYYSDFFLSVDANVISYVKEYYICLTCRKSLYKEHIPCQSVANSLFMAEIPKEISA